MLNNTKRTKHKTKMTNHANLYKHSKKHNNNNNQSNTHKDNKNKTQNNKTQ